MRTDGVDLGSHSLVSIHAAFFTKCRADDFVVGEWNALFVHLAKATLVNKLSHCLKCWVAVGDVWLHQFQHVEDWLVHLEEDTIAKLEEDNVDLKTKLNEYALTARMHMCAHFYVGVCTLPHN